MKVKIMNSFIVFFMFLSFLFFMFPTVKMNLLGYMIETSKTENISSILDIKTEIINQPLEIESPSVTEMIQSKKQERYKIGELSIPSVSLNVDILAGVNKDSLNYGAASVFINRNPEKENISLLGHHFYDDTLLFGPLLKTKIGQSVYMTHEDKIYHYKIREQIIVPQTQIEILENTSEPQLTLVTCDSPLYTEKRVVVFCDLEKVERTNKKSKTEMMDTQRNSVKQTASREGQLFMKYFGKIILICIFFLFLVLIISVRLKNKEI